MISGCLSPEVTQNLMAATTFTVALLAAFVAMLFDIATEGEGVILDRHGLLLFAGLVILVMHGLGMVSILRAAGCL